MSAAQAPGQPHDETDDRSNDGKGHDRDDERPGIRGETSCDVVREQRPAAICDVQSEDHTDDDPDHQADQERPADPAVDARGEGQRHGGQRQRAEEEHAQENPPADRAEQPLAQPQRNADADQKSREDPRAGGDAAECRSPLDGVANVRELGLREIDVRIQEPLRGILRGSDLLTEPWRRLRSDRRWRIRPDPCIAP